MIENDSVEIKQTKENGQNNQSSDQPDKFIEDIVIQTIKAYLQTQNEAQFEKDKKFSKKISQIYRRLAKRHRWKIVTSNTKQETHKEIMKIISKKIAS